MPGVAVGRVEVDAGQLRVYAYRMESPAGSVGPTIRLFVATSAPMRKAKNGAGGARFGAMNGGGAFDAGYGGAIEGMVGDPPYGAGYAAPGMGFGIGGGANAAIWKLVDMESIETAPELFPFRLAPEELRVLIDSIQVDFGLRLAIEKINTPDFPEAELPALQTEIKALLTTEYETGLVRQAMEVERIERRVGELKRELERRAAAKERVVDVKLGRIVLEAQGLLEIPSPAPASSK